MADATAADVIAGRARWSASCSDNLPWLQALPDACVDLVFTSPPFEAARTYSVGFAARGQAWVDWLAPRVAEAARVCRGLVLVNAAPQLTGGSCSPCVEWLVADLTRRFGLVMGPAPYCYFRFGIPGSGGPRYHRRDWEPVYAFCLPDRLPLAWSDNLATGHAPRWAPGGACSHRMIDGKRASPHGVRRDGVRVGNRRGKDDHRAAEESPEHAAHAVAKAADDHPTLELTGEPETTSADVHPLLAGGGRGKGIGRDPDGSRVKRQSRKTVTREREGMHAQTQGYESPAVANSGNVVRERYDAEEVRRLIADLVTRDIEPGDVIRCLVGGNQMGSKLAHDNEAPFPERLAEFFALSYCPPGGVLLDPFAGSGTSLSVAVRLGRRAIGCDVRESQVAIVRRRLSGETPCLPFGG